MSHWWKATIYKFREVYTTRIQLSAFISHLFFAANYKLRCLIKRWGSKIWSQSSALSPTVLHCPLSLLVCHLCTCCPLPVDYLIPMPKRGCDVCLWNRNPLLWNNVLLLDRIMSDLVLFELLRRRAVWPVLFAQCVTPTALAAKVWWLILNNRMHYIRSDRLCASFCLLQILSEL